MSDQERHQRFAPLPAVPAAEPTDLTYYVGSNEQAARRVAGELEASGLNPGVQQHEDLFVVIVAG